MERHGHDITYLPVDHYGRVRAAGLAAAMRPDTRLVSIMHANNETGTIQPIAELADIAHASGALFHCDAAQSAGKIACHVNELKVDLLTIAGHKLYAPKGIGALYIRRGTRVEPLIHGAGQESGRRAGTENVMLAAALGKACELAIPQTGDPSLKVLTDQFFAMLQATWGSLAVLNGHPVERLPNTLNISFTGWQGQSILDRLDHVAASTGSACHAGMTEISPVLKAMGLDEAAARGAVRFSLGRMTTNDEIKAVVRQLTTFIERPAGPRSGGIGSRDDL
ncbi:MAG: cysteine desulfurase family protein [Eubacteriales bacterium]|nr:cysteine desulfurase family protein [Eubacteriales bacterium]